MAMCKLCRLDKPLCQSHIYPEFLYATLYNDDGRMMGITGVGRRGWTLVQKGLRDELLCRECEALLNERYEIPFQQQWTNRYPLPERANEGEMFYAQFAYATFKLFHLSILFRAAVSSHPMFGVVTLGKHEDIIRRMILGGDAGRVDRYPIFATALINGRAEIERRLIAAPTLTRVGGHRIYGFTFDGVLWWYSVSSHRNLEFERGGLQGNGAMAFYVSPWHEHAVTQAAAKALRNPRQRLRPAQRNGT
ncbi:hypothetical protein [Dokdonella soli]|uniref:HNH endonuclease n=1 Tax=Dokdonella soli TaxID=529810 RepID=A0ABN1IBG3_9GAMM